MSGHTTSFLIVIAVPLALLAIEGLILWVRRVPLRRPRLNPGRTANTSRPIPFNTRREILRKIIRKI